jgi:outer membrane lipoprotein-sorting protein
VKRILSFSSAFAVAMTMATTVWADILPLSGVSAYFNSLKGAQSTFRQFNEDGSVSTGNFYIQRPGKMRFEYDPPDSAVVVAGSGAVVIYDKKSNQPAETYPLRRTPLWLILADTVDLAREEMVIGHSFDGTYTLVTAQDPENPEYGNIQLVLSSDPVNLQGWVVNDANGGRTQVVLDKLSETSGLASSLFDVGKARPTRGR